VSPTATHTVDEAKQAVLAAADSLFYANGIAGVAMSDVRDRAGVSMRRLYAMYPSKSDLVAGWLSERHETWMAWFDRTVDQRVAAGQDPVLATLDAIGQWIASPGYRGCGFINALAETNEITDGHRRIIAGHKRDLTTRLTGLATSGARELPGWFPAALGVIIDGVIVQCSVFGTSEPLEAARSAVLRLIEMSSS
jgi:AcrR family transcriptional regulator